jgi:hypothetical protein
LQEKKRPSWSAFAPASGTLLASASTRAAVAVALLGLLLMAWVMVGLG